MQKSLLAVVVLGLVVVAASLAQDAAKAQRQKDNHHELQLTGDMAEDMQMMNQMMVKKLGKGDRDYEKRFIDMMIPHHEGAIMMAKDALKNAKKPEIKEMAEKMIEEQQKEIAKLKEYRMEWYGTKPATD